MRTKTASRGRLDLGTVLIRGIACLLLVMVGVLMTAQAEPLRWAAQGDVLTMDPHAQNVITTVNVQAQIYEALVDYDQRMALTPGLAESWTQKSPTVWVFNLRRDVRFHDGTPFTADDVVFSLERAKSPTSNFRVHASGAASVRKLDAHSVEITTAAPNLGLLTQLARVLIMSKSWCEKNGVERPQDFKNKEETYAVLHANGTGPYMLRRREPGVKTVLVENPSWWGKREGNLTEATFLPIESNATRLAALLSGEIDFVLDPPLQDLARLKGTANMKVVEGPESRIVFLGMDQNRDELLYSNVKGRNPFKDVRVRRALQSAIDIEAIKTRIMRGYSEPAGTLALPYWGAYFAAEMDKAPPFDQAKAKNLLVEAGYPDGFEVTLDCPNARYVNDEQICQALAAMFTQVGVMTRLNSMPPAKYFAKLNKHDTSFYMLGWGGTPSDPITLLRPVIHSPRAGGDGDFNFGRAHNAVLDRLIDQINVEPAFDTRRQLVAEAVSIHDREVIHIPLHRQVIPWAMRGDISVVHRPDNRLELRWTHIDKRGIGQVRN